MTEVSWRVQLPLTLESCSDAHYETRDMAGDLAMTEMSVYRVKH
jgi:hypothetical protein